MILIPIIFTLAVGWTVFSDKPQTKTTKEVYIEKGGIYPEPKEGKR